MARPPSWQLGVRGSTPGAGPEHGVLGTGQGPPGAGGKTIVSSFVLGFQMMMIDNDADGQHER